MVPTQARGLHTVTPTTAGVSWAPRSLAESTAKLFGASWDSDPGVSSYSCKILVALSEPARVLAVCFLFGGGLEEAIWWGLGDGLKVCLHSRHCFYLDGGFTWGWLKYSRELLALDTTTNTKALLSKCCPWSPESSSLSMPDLFTKLDRVLGWALSLSPPA